MTVEDEASIIHESTNSVEQVLPFSFAKRYGIVALPGTPLFARYSAPLEGLLEAQRYLGISCQIEEVSDETFDRLLQERYENNTGEATEVVEDLGDEIDLEILADSLNEPEDLLESEDDAPIIRLLNALLSQAIKEEASDIHIEGTESHFGVRIRVDGELKEILRARRSLAPLVISRIKIMAHLDIAEKRLPQDGRISVRVAGRAVDIRVSTMPSNHGERVVLRLLDKQARRLDLRQLGFERDMLIRFEKLIRHPHGIILVTGPTGSGKTTTLYAALSVLNESRRNIMTVEDPIEYDLGGISQSQVNMKTEFSFARGLRAILRQDPDVVMVGEVRDLETAQIAIQASLTGHLVFSTLHTNTAVGAIARLRDMGIEPFLLSSSLIGVLAQRLVRTLCPECRQAYQPTGTERSRLGIGDDQEVSLYKPEGCQSCNYQGYRGRTGIYELIAVDKAMQELIHSEASEPQLEKHVRQEAGSIVEDGVAKVLAGITSLEEVMRVTRES